MPLMEAVRPALMPTSRLMESVHETIMKPVTAALPTMLMDHAHNAAPDSSMPTLFATAILFKAASKSKVTHVLPVELASPLLTVTALQSSKTVKPTPMQDNAATVLMGSNWLIPTVYLPLIHPTAHFPITMDVFSAQTDSS
jgi:hypothetical protein